MLVKFYDRVPGQHKHIVDAEMVAIPREGESVIFGEAVKTVHSVTWNPAEASVTILVK